MKARFIEHIGTMAALRIYWHGEVACPGMGYHNAETFLMQNETVFDSQLGGQLKDYADDSRWPVVCDHCPTPVPQGAGTTKQIFRSKRYNTDSGKPEPGCLFFIDHECHSVGFPYCMSDWRHCDGLHLHAILPNGELWDIDSRARNCDMRSDNNHRCWIRHGDPRTGLVHVDKSPEPGKYTCHAGSGSIDVPGWHGFLHHGVFHL